MRGAPAGPVRSPGWCSRYASGAPGHRPDCRRDTTGTGEPGRPGTLRDGSTPPRRESTDGYDCARYRSSRGPAGDVRRSLARPRSRPESRRASSDAWHSDLMQDRARWPRRSNSSVGALSSRLGGSGDPGAVRGASHGRQDTAGAWEVNRASARRFSPQELRRCRSAANRRRSTSDPGLARDDRASRCMYEFSPLR